MTLSVSAVARPRLPVKPAVRFRGSMYPPAQNNEHLQAVKGTLARTLEKAWQLPLDFKRPNGQHFLLSASKTSRIKDAAYDLMTAFTVNGTARGSIKYAVYLDERGELNSTYQFCIATNEMPHDPIVLEINTSLCAQPTVSLQQGEKMRISQPDNELCILIGLTLELLNKWLSDARDTPGALCSVQGAAYRVADKLWPESLNILQLPLPITMMPPQLLTGGSVSPSRMGELV